MDVLDVLWRRSVVVITAVQLHSTKSELRLCGGSSPARSVSEIRDGEDLWQWSWIKSKRLSSVTILQKTIHHGNSFFVTTYILVIDLSTNVN